MLTQSTTKSRHRLEGAACARCAKPIIRRASRVRDGRPVYCGHRCSSVAQWARFRAAIRERLLAPREISSTGCWLWTGSRSPEGYGRIGFGRRSPHYVHRLAYEIFRGDIAANLTVDHRCRTRACFNPDHLRLLTNLDNARDGGFQSGMVRAGATR